MSSSRRCRIRSTPAAPAVARRYVVSALADAPSDVVDAATLMVSELATNCVLYAGGHFTVSVDTCDSAVEVQVADDGGGVVAPRDPGPAEPSGRGLRIVDQLADEWGVREYVDRDGKSVWFTLRLYS